MPSAARVAGPPTGVARFVLRTVGWLPLAFAVWYFAAPLLLAPVAWILRAVTDVAFASLVRSIEQSASVLTFVTTLRPGTAIERGVVTVDVNLLLYSFGLPMFVALTLAAREPGWKRKLAIGYAVLLPFTAWGTLADFLKNVAITAGPAVASQTGFSEWQRETIAFAYQFGSLILPAVAPAVLWVTIHGRFLAGLRQDFPPAPD
ncbi:MAG: exosortase H-associated membrane protein [Candidatus Levyibacteriota bacterium]